MTTTVTLVVHGTFATQEQWWRLGSGRETTFADRLESELSRRGLSGSVWKPALAGGLDYSSFAWSGRNRHRDRIQGAKTLALSLNRLAQRVAATPDDPLIVNFVAHSHGGNVVLEALRRLRPNVRAGRISLLGTPLVAVKPAFRVARFIFSAVLLGFFFLGILMVAIQLGTFFFTLFEGNPHFLDAEREVIREGRPVHEIVKGGSVVAILFPTLIAYGWLFWAFGNLLDVAWRVLCRVFEPLAWLQGRTSSVVYGPSQRKLSTSLRGHPILLLTTQNDEADLLLQIGSAPARVYREYVAASFSKLGRVLEFVLLRPFVLGVFMKATEMLLEVFSLGFSLWRSLLFDYEVAPLRERPYYPPHLLVQQEIDVHRRRDSAVANLVPEVTRRDTPQIGPEQRRSLHISLREVVGELKRQVQLRHSTYYEDRDVLERVADFLTGGDVKTVGETKSSLSAKPSGSFWEVLFVANALLAAVFIWIAGLVQFFPNRPVMGLLIFLAGYLYPLVLLSIVGALYWVVRRRWPLRPLRWFWVIWAICGLGLLNLALQVRLSP